MKRYSIDDDEDYRAQDEARFMADTDQPDDYEPGICPHCNGSGEGQYDGTRCNFCKGKGEI